MLFSDRLSHCRRDVERESEVRPLDLHDEPDVLHCRSCDEPMSPGERVVDDQCERCQQAYAEHCAELAFSSYWGGDESESQREIREVTERGWRCSR